MAFFKTKTEEKRVATARRTPATPTVTRLGWLGLKTADLMAETTFIERTLGLKYLDEGNSADAHHVRYDCGLELELVSGGTAWATRPRPRRGQPDLPFIPSFAVDNIAQVASKLSEQDVLLTQVFEQGWAASFLFFDPDRNLWQVSETRNEPAAQVDRPVRLASLWLAVEDLAAQIEFYQHVLGLPLVDEDTRPRPITENAERELRDEPPAEGEPSPLPELPQVRFDPNGLELPDHAASGAVFFNQGVRLALTSGGQRLEDGAERVWGRDTAFLPGLQTNDLTGYATRLRQAGLEITGPFPYYHNQANRDPRQSAPSQAIRFTDPEGHRWQVFQ